MDYKQVHLIEIKIKRIKNLFQTKKKQKTPKMKPFLFCG
jgi:hypothetical protein